MAEYTLGLHGRVQQRHGVEARNVPDIDEPLYTLPLISKTHKQMALGGAGGISRGGKVSSMKVLPWSRFRINPMLDP